ncbi:hypothetical protein JTB14_034442 [Gonioctena quinquepunctata]|nr:hypothetical protein JTB14_034442 [Gonioctena quinquepunctata]
MSMFLKHEDLWYSIVGYPEDDTTTASVKTRKEQKALTKLCLMVQPNCYSHVRATNTAEKAWTKLQSAHEDKGLNRRITLLRSLCSIKLENFHKIEDYVNEFMNASQKLNSIGKPVDDELLGTMMLQGRYSSKQALYSKHNNVKVPEHKNSWCWNCRSPDHYKQNCTKKYINPSLLQVPLIRSLRRNPINIPRMRFCSLH